MARAVALIWAPPSKMLAERQGFQEPFQVPGAYWNRPSSTPLEAAAEPSLPVETEPPVEEELAASAPEIAPAAQVFKSSEEGGLFDLAAELEKEDLPLLALALGRMRKGQVELEPGFDGEYGVVSLLTEKDFRPQNQLSLF